MRRRLFLTSALLALAAAGCADGPGAPGRERITIGTGPAGTLYNQIGTALSTVLQQELEVPSTARPYTGSSIYIPQMHRGELPFGINNVIDTRVAYLGERVFAKPMNEVRAAMLLVRAPYQYFVRADSGIRSMADLEGRTIVTDFRSLATFGSINEASLATAGLTLDDVDGISVAGVPEAIRALVEDRAAAAGTMLGIPALREAHATVPGGLRVLDLGPNEAAITSMAGVDAVTMQPGPGTVAIEKPTRIAVLDVYLNTSTHVDDEVVYAVVRTLHRNWAELQKMLPALRSLPAEDIVPLRIGHPYHPGAIRYFKEAGLWTDAHEQVQRKLLG